MSRAQILALGADEPLRPRVLIADDHPETLLTHAMLLREAGYSVATADSARICVATLHDESCDLLLLDLRLGHVNGITLLNGHDPIRWTG
jgi:CheY-like chemotaxis protein